MGPQAGGHPGQRRRVSIDAGIRLNITKQQVEDLPPLGHTRMIEGVTRRGWLRPGGPLRTSQGAAIAGIIFGVLLITALVLLRVSVPAHPEVAGRVAGRFPAADGGGRRPEPDPVRRDRLPVVHRGAAGPDRRARGPPVRHRVPGQRPAVRRHAVRGRGGGRRHHRRRVVGPARRGLAGAEPQPHRKPAERLRDADGGGVHAHHGEHRAPHRDRVPVARPGRAGLRADPAGRRRDIALGGVAVPGLDPRPQPG